MKYFLHILSLHTPQNIIRSSRRRSSRCPIMLITAFITGLISQLYAAVINGEVRLAATSAAIDGANVEVVGTQWGASTGQSGAFRIIDMPAGKWQLSASHLGCETQKIPISISAADTLFIAFSLRESTLPLDDVVYTASRTLQFLKSVPVATELITRSDIESRAAFTVAEALETEIGFQVQEDFSGQGVSLQGIDPDKVLILIDGNRVIGRVNGSLDLEQVGTVGVKQIEIVKGAISALYGSEAIGGVVNIITAEAANPFDLTLDLSAGGYMPNNVPRKAGDKVFLSTNWSPGVSAGIRRGVAGFTGGFRYLKRGLIDVDPSTNHTEGVDAVDRYNVDSRLDIDLRQQTKLSLGWRMMDELKSWVEDSGLQSVQISYDDSESNHRNDFTVQVTDKPSASGAYSATLYHSANSHLWEKHTRPNARVKDFSRGVEQYTELSSTFTRRISRAHQLTTGLDLYRWDIDAHSELSGIPSLFESSIDVWALYAQDEIKFADYWVLLPGARYERHAKYGDNIAPRLGAMWTPFDRFKVRASVGQGYRAPSAKELFYVFNHSSAGYIVYGNPDLEPEKSSNYSLNFEYNYRNRNVSRVSFFFNDLRNLIEFDSIGASEELYNGIYRYENITSAWTGGVEIERGFRIGAGLGAKLAYSYLATRNRQTGNLLLRRPRHSGRWDITWARGDWKTKVWGQYTDRMLYQSIWGTDDLESDEWTNSYQLWNINVTRRLRRGLDVYVKAENLFDYTHARYGPRSGRVAWAGVRWQDKG